MIHKVMDELPNIKTPVNILVDRVWYIGQLLWEHPLHEDNFESYLYWDDPTNSGYNWEWYSVTHWAPLPDIPEELNYEELEEWMEPTSTGVIIF